MKVCMFVFGVCAPDVRVFKEARTLADAGHDVRIIGFLGSGTVPFEERDGFRIFRVALDPFHRKILRLVSLPVRLAERSRSSQRRTSLSNSSGSRIVDAASVDVPKHGYCKVSLRDALMWIGRPLHRALVALAALLPNAYLSYLDYYYRSFWLARQEPVDIYHAHDLNTLPVAWLARRFRGGKLVYDSHELWLDRNKLHERSKLNAFMVKRIESFLIRRTDANIVVGISCAEVLGQRYRVARPTVILNAPYYEPVERSCLLRDELGISIEDRILLFIGRITSKRGLEELVRSIQYVERCALVFMGYGSADYVAGLKKLIEHEGVTKRVHFFGPVPSGEVSRYAASADVSVVDADIACLSYYYCCPNKFFESVAAGLPLAVVDIPDLKRLVEGYDIGVTFDPDDFRAAADAVSYILSDEKRYEEMRRNALEAAKILNWENESRKLLTLYEGLGDKSDD